MVNKARSRKYLYSSKEFGFKCYSYCTYLHTEFRFSYRFF